MSYLKSLFVAAVVALSVAGSASADITFAFEANSAETDPLFSFDGTTLAADNHVTLTVSDFDTDITVTYTDAAFDFSATLSGSTVVPLIGTVYTFTDIVYHFYTSEGDLILTANSDIASMLRVTGQSASALTTSSASGGIYTEGPILSTLLQVTFDQDPGDDPMDKTIEDFVRHDWGFAFAGIVDNGQGGFTANSSYVGTAEFVTRIVPLPVAAYAALPLLGMLGVRRARRGA